VASNYTVVSQTKDVIVLGPTQVLDVQRVGFVTHPTGIYAEYPIDWQTWIASRGAPELGSIAGAIESLIATTAAVGATYVQDVAPNDLLVDYLDVVVQYDPGNPSLPMMYTSVLVPLGTFSAAADPWFTAQVTSPQELIDEAYQALANTAGQ
jgi:hypothetical protein